MDGTLLLAVLLGVTVLLWRTNVEMRTIANEAAHAACRDAGLQLLDGTVVFRTLRLARHRFGRTMERTYVFDYTDDGASRRQGFVILHGRHVEIVGLGPTLVPTTLH
jgi:hypothetical protein